MSWFWDLGSEEYGNDTFGPYDSEEEAMEGIERVQAKSNELNDGIEREYGEPYLEN